MEKPEKTEIIFNTLDKGAEQYQKDTDYTYLEALALMADSVFKKEPVSTPSDKIKRKINYYISELPNEDDISPVDWQKAMQLATLKGMKEGTQPNHLMTPDGLGIFIAYLAEKIIPFFGDEEITMYDPAVGSGNLMTVLLNQVSKRVHFIGADADETLLKLAFANANLVQKQVELFHQDSINEQSFLKGLDIIVSDLPIGYYPNDDIAAQFATASKEGHSFVHHLLIEKSINQLNEGGFFVAIVPKNLFVTKEAPDLSAFIKQESILYAFMELPRSMFKNNDMSKSILVLRKKGTRVRQPKEALLAELPSFSNGEKMKSMMGKISEWFLLQQQEQNNK